MKYNNIYAKFLFATILLLALSFAACSDDDDNTQSVLLEAFGPSPAFRGGELTFIGKNMDKVTKVIFPDNVEVSDIKIISSEQIKVTVPQSAKVGYVILETPGGKITTKTSLSFTEPIVITEISPSPIKAGQTLTIKGDYLNLMTRIIFANNVEVPSEDFITWERAKIEVVVPNKAQTGTITLANNATIPLELVSEDILDIVLPSVTSITDLTGKKPGDLIEITGTDLDLVTNVVLPDGLKGDTINFTVSNNKLQFTLTNKVTDGVIVMLPASNVAVPIANIGMAVPSDLVATPNTDIKSGDVITIVGKDMNLVTSVSFPGVSDNIEPSTQTATQIKVTVPSLTTSGNLILHTLSGKTVSVSIVTLKPTVTSYSSNSVPAGGDLTINGTNLDLVSSVTFGGGKNIVVSPSASKIELDVPVDAESGKLTLVMKNSETVETQSLTVTKPEFAYIPVLPETEISAGSIQSFDIANETKLTGVELNGVSVQYILQGSKLSVPIASNANGDTPLKLISSNGEITYTISVKGVGPLIIPVWSGSQPMGAWTGYIKLESPVFTPVKVGDIIKVTIDPSSIIVGTSEGSFKNGGWSQIAPGTDYFNITGDFTLTVTEDIKAALLSGGLIIGGQKYTATQVDIYRY